VRPYPVSTSQIRLTGSGVGEAMPPKRREQMKRDARDRIRRMFKVLELKGGPTVAVEVGGGYSTREKAIAAVKMHLKTFKVSGHNLEGNYWWARDSEGLRKCWISAD
jgi:hypothetical protein